MIILREEILFNLTINDYIGLGSIIGLILFLIILQFYLKNPFKYPILTINIDATGRRQPRKLDLLDEYLIENKMNKIDYFWNKTVPAWEEKCERKISKSPFKRHRRKQYERAYIKKPFNFNIIRTQTRYTQRNYIRTPYQVDNIVGQIEIDYETLKWRYKQLENIEFSCTLNQYAQKNQRKLMTRKLRKQIMERDNYTCQRCGKYMPDEVGLQIDHIIPVSRGGKSIPTNLQVLCSRCNNSKRAKIRI